jgi:hypothetical protein
MDQNTKKIEEMPTLNKISCPKCGCYGFHACLGEPIIWTPSKKIEFHKTLLKYIP